MGFPLWGGCRADGTSSPGAGGIPDGAKKTGRAVKGKPPGAGGHHPESEKWDQAISAPGPGPETAAGGGIIPSSQKGSGRIRSGGFAGNPESPLEKRH